MWTRKALKAKAKASLKMNYWKTVLVALLLMAIGGGGASAAGSAGGSTAERVSSQNTTTYELNETTDYEDLDELIGELEETQTPSDDLDDPDELPAPIADMLEQEQGHETSNTLSPAVIGTLIIAFLVLLLVVIAVAMTISAFVLNPLEMGAKRFFALNLNQRAEMKEVVWAFDHNYREVVKTLFWRDIYTLLWGLLLIIPGFVKAYEYRMIPYLLADDPTMTKERAFAESKRMMQGNKWRAFVLDLSFIGWELLSVLTLGILAIFYVAPYIDMTNAALYEALRYGDGQPEDPSYTYDEPTTLTPASQVPVPPFAEADAPVPVWNDALEAADGFDTPTLPEA